MEYTVIKTIEYYYTVEASTHAEACKQVEQYGFIEADSFSTIEIEAESIEEYEENLK
jgi:hypothetical protein